MSTKYLSSALIGLVLLFLMSGCSSLSNANEDSGNGTAALDGPTLSLFVGDKEVLAKPSDNQLSDKYRKGITIHDLLQDSGVATFAKDKRTLLSVSDISLGPGMYWELKLDGEVILNAGWDQEVDYNSHFEFTVQSQNHQEPLQTVMLTVNGGSEEAELNHSYVVLFSDDLTVGGLLNNVGGVQLTEDNQTIYSINGYIPQSDELWKLKANEKQLLSTGMDMKLRPDDELEIALTLR